MSQVPDPSDTFDLEQEYYRPKWSNDVPMDVDVFEGFADDFHVSHLRVDLLPEPTIDEMAWMIAILRFRQKPWGDWIEDRANYTEDVFPPPFDVRELMEKGWPYRIRAEQGRGYDNTIRLRILWAESAFDEDWTEVKKRLRNDVPLGRYTARTARMVQDRLQPNNPDYVGEWPLLYLEYPEGTEFDEDGDTVDPDIVPVETTEWTPYPKMVKLSRRARALTGSSVGRQRKMKEVMQLREAQTKAIAHRIAYLEGMNREIEAWEPGTFARADHFVYLQERAMLLQPKKWLNKISGATPYNMLNEMLDVKIGRVALTVWEKQGISPRSHKGQKVFSSLISYLQDRSGGSISSTNPYETGDWF